VQVLSEPLACPCMLSAMKTGMVDKQIIISVFFL